MGVTEIISDRRFFNKDFKGKICFTKISKGLIVAFLKK
jgi:hypothetical protein